MVKERDGFSAIPLEEMNSDFAIQKEQMEPSKIIGSQENVCLLCCFQQIITIAATVLILQMSPYNWKRYLFGLPTTYTNKFLAYHSMQSDLTNETENVLESLILDAKSLRDTISPDENTDEKIERLSKYKCGVLFHFHINKCAGDSLRFWMDKASKRRYHRMYHKNRINSPFESSTWWKEEIKNVTNWLHSIDQDNWSVLELHHGIPGMYYLEGLGVIKKWSEIIESKECAFVKMIILRDPLDRFVSNVIFNRVHPFELEEFAQSRANWQSRYLLYGNCGKLKGQIQCGYNPSGNFTMTPAEIDFEEVMRQIKRFDLIGTVAEFPHHIKRIKSITGWTEKDPGRHHKTTNSYNISRSLLNKFVKENREDYLLYYGVIESLR